MNCLECQAWLQQRLDGEDLPATEGVEQHWTACATCRAQHSAALRLLEGLKQLPPPRPAPGFSQALAAKVLQDRRQRREKLRRRVYVTMALAASVLLLLFLGYSWAPRTPQEGPAPQPPIVKIEPKKDVPQPKREPAEERQPTRHDTRNAIASLTERWVDTTRDHAKVVLVATNLDTMERLPAMNELPPLNPDAREASQEVTDGVRAVTRNTRRAFDFFARELPMPEIETHKN